LRPSQRRKHLRVRADAGVGGRPRGTARVRGRPLPRLEGPVSFPLASDANAGRVVVFTGGGTGIGKATALAFARTGARVAICGRREEPRASAREEAELAGAPGAGVEGLSRSCDIREPDQG